MNEAVRAIEQTNALLLESISHSNSQFDKAFKSISTVADTVKTVKAAIAVSNPGVIEEAKQYRKDKKKKNRSPKARASRRPADNQKASPTPVNTTNTSTTNTIFKKSQAEHAMSRALRRCECSKPIREAASKDTIYCDQCLPDDFSQFPRKEGQVPGSLMLASPDVPKIGKVFSVVDGYRTQLGYMFRVAEDKNASHLVMPFHFDEFSYGGSLEVLINNEIHPLDKSKMKRYMSTDACIYLDAGDPRAAHYVCKYLSKAAEARVRASVRYGVSAPSVS